MPILRPYTNQSPVVYYGIYSMAQQPQQKCVIFDLHTVTTSLKISADICWDVCAMLCLPKYPMSKDSNRFKHHISVLYNIIYIHNIIYIYISCMCQHSESWKQDETSRNFNPLEKRTMLIYADIC